jgi:protein-S-isoprenylcysteine O-methyltransferase Ste14
VSPLPYTNAGAQIAFYIILGTFSLLEWRVRLRSGLNPHGTRTDRRSRVVVYVSVTAGVAAGFILAGHAPSAAISDGRWPVFVFGLVLMSGGIAIRQWAVTLLGGFFTTDVRVHPNQTVVDGGPYRVVRHPSYSGMLITLAGTGLALGNWAALCALVVLPTIGLTYRIRVEERALLEALGEPYRRFAAGRARLIPGLW